MSSAFFVPLATSRLTKQMNLFRWPKRNYIGACDFPIFKYTFFLFSFKTSRRFS